MRLETRSLFVLLVIAVMLIACGVSSDAPQPTADVSSTCDAQYVASTDVGKHIGQEVTVCGEVRDYFYKDRDPDRPTLLLFDPGYLTRRKGSLKGELPANPDAFAVIIWRRDSRNFPPNFGSLYSGKMVCTTGVVELYDDKLAIVASTPDQIKVGC